MIVLRERSEGDAERFESALWKAKKGIKEACEIFEEMKEQFSERSGGSYNSRYSQRGYDERGYDERGGYGERGGYYGREWDDMHERRGGYRRY